MTPKNLKPKTPPESWEAGADDREIDKLWHWKFYTDAEDRSLDRMIEAMRRDTAAVRALMNIKLRLHAAGIFIPPSSKEHFLMAAEFRGWAEPETDPKKKAELISLGNLAEGLARAAHRREVEAKAKPRKRRPSDPTAEHRFLGHDGHDGPRFQGVATSSVVSCQLPDRTVRAWTFSTMRARRGDRCASSAGGLRHTLRGIEAKAKRPRRSEP